MNDYRYAISNVKINDDVYESLLQSALNDIAVKTNYFKRSFLFDVYKENQDSIFDFEAMAFNAESDATSNILAINSDIVTSVGYKMKSFIQVDDIIKFSSSSNVFSFQKGTSAIGSCFKQLSSKEFVYTGIKINNDNEYKRFICVYSYIPRIDFLYEGDEDFISNAIIAKLRYDSYIMYYESQDTAFLQTLKTAYEYELQQIKNKIPENVVQQQKNLIRI